MTQAANPTIAKAHQLLQQRRHADAGVLLERHVRANPRDASAHHLLAICHMESGRADLALTRMRRAVDLAPNHAGLRCDMAQMHIGAQQFDEAEASVDKAIELDPSFAYALGAKVELLQTVGRHDEAAALAAQAVEKHPADARIVLAFAQIARRIKRERDAIDLLEKLLRTNIPDSARATALFRLGALHDAVGEYETAWKAFTTANILIGTQFDPDRHDANTDAMIANWSAEALRTIPRSNQRSEQPVFIVGMPRSGTSLVEQVLASHPKVHGAGELPDLPVIAADLKGAPNSIDPVIVDPSVITRKGVDGAAKKFLGSLYTKGARGPRVTDKLPINFFLVGVIDRLFPNARVIHTKRNALDTCVSCYTNHFQGAYHWAYRLDHLGRFHNAYERLMDHWKATLDIPIHTVVYEELVDDLEGQARKLIDFIGLEWDDACLEFHKSKRVVTTLSNEQVRRPIYKSSSGRWRNYEPWLGPLIDALDGPPTGD